MKVMGIDASLTATGVAIVTDGIATQQWLIRTTPDVSDMQRFDYVAKQVIGIIFGQDSNAVVDLVAMEGVYASRNALVFARLVALQTVVQYALHRSQVPYVVLPPATWRKIVFGPGSKVDKEKVRTYAATRLKAHLGDLDVERVDLNVLEAVMVALAAWKIEQDPSLKPTPKRRKRAVQTT